MATELQLPIFLDTTPEVPVFDKPVMNPPEFVFDRPDPASSEDDDTDSGLNLVLVEELKRLQLTDDEIAPILGVSLEEIIRLKKRDMKFKQAYETGEARGKRDIRRKQFDKAMNGDAQMLKWLGKQYLGQVDRVETERSGRPSLWDAIAADLGFSSGA